MKIWYISGMETVKNLAEREKELDCLYAIAEILTSLPADTAEQINKCAQALCNAMTYPDNAKIRITAGITAYGCDNPAYETSVFSASSMTENGEKITIEIWYDIQAAFVEREKKLVVSTASLLSNSFTKNFYFTRLIEKTRELESKNIALKEILQHIETEREEHACSIKKSAGLFVMPLICEMEDTSLTPRQKGLLNEIRENIDSIFSSSSGRLCGFSGILTPREIEICSLIKNGETTKDIATLLNISPLTVERHRNTIRKKLGINRKNTNLVIHLRNNS